jgi:hypothetical protein
MNHRSSIFGIIAASIMTTAICLCITGVASGDYSNPVAGSSSERANLLGLLLENRTVCKIIPDVTGDGGSDLLCLRYSFQGGKLSSNIAVLNGSNGSVLWQQEFKNAFAIAYLLGDVNEDGYEDLLINLVLDFGFIPYSGTFIVSGRTGATIWNRIQYLAASVCVKGDDINADGIPEIAEHVFVPDSDNNSISTEVNMLDGRSGGTIHTSAFIDSIAVLSPAGNLTGLGKSTFLSSYRGAGGDHRSEDLIDIHGLISTSISAYSEEENGSSLLWRRGFDSFALPFSVRNLTGDGLDYAFVYEINGSLDFPSFCVNLLDATNGSTLMTRCSDDPMLVVPGADFTGDGVVDLLIMPLFGGADGPTAVDSLTGDVLWTADRSVVIWPEESASSRVIP